MIIDIQFNQGSATWDQLRDAVLAAESSGFCTAWIADHLSGSVMSAPSMPECFTVLGALAVSTTTIGLGLLVANVGNRHPGLLANAAATVQNISGGRFILGLGAGASPSSTFAQEQRALGIELPATMKQRHARLEHALEVIEEIWSPTRDDKFAKFPSPEQDVPIIVGVNSVSLARIAGARTNGINVRASHPQRGQILAEALSAAERGKGVDDFDVSVWDWFDESLLDPQSQQRQKLQAEGVNRLILLMRGVPDIARLEQAPVS